MKYFTKKKLKRIKEGYHDDLIDGIEYLIDLSHEDGYDLGYESAMSDLDVYSERLAERIIQEAEGIGKVDEQGYYLLEYDEIKEVITEFFNDFKIEKDGI